MKLKLDQENLTNDFFNDSRLIGIMAESKNYEFCWMLNKELGFNFELNIEIEVQVQKRGRNSFFPVYHYAESDVLVHHYIYKNLFEGEFLLSEFRHLDFLWLLKGEDIEEVNFYDLIQTLRSLNGVQLVAELSNEKILKKNNLIF